MHPHAWTRRRRRQVRSKKGFSSSCDSSSSSCMLSIRLLLQLKPLARRVPTTTAKKEAAAAAKAQSANEVLLGGTTALSKASLLRGVASSSCTTPRINSDFLLCSGQAAWATPSLLREMSKMMSLWSIQEMPRTVWSRVFCRKVWHQVPGAPRSWRYPSGSHSMFTPPMKFSFIVGNCSGPLSGSRRRQHWLPPSTLLIGVSRYSAPHPLWRLQ
mmetsp:Transcript_8996/g.27350  ORF Transcript_8996/g.27350 Transcript_8996/m.27350 type:complete len:214 (+) Transcript_8996:52-693(+)